MDGCLCMPATQVSTEQDRKSMCPRPIKSSPTVTQRAFTCSFTERVAKICSWLSKVRPKIPRMPEYLIPRPDGSLESHAGFRRLQLDAILKDSNPEPLKSFL